MVFNAAFAATAGADHVRICGSAALAFILLPDLTQSVDALIRKLDIVEKSTLWAAE